MHACGFTTGQKTLENQDWATRSWAVGRWAFGLPDRWVVVGRGPWAAGLFLAKPDKLRQLWTSLGSKASHTLFIEDNELTILLLYFSQVMENFKLFIFGLVLHVSLKPILWCHQLWRHINEIWEFKSSKFFNFVYTVYLQSITFWGYTLLKEELLGVLMY